MTPPPTHTLFLLCYSIKFLKSAIQSILHSQDAVMLGHIMKLRKVCYKGRPCLNAG